MAQLELSKWTNERFIYQERKALEMKKKAENFIRNTTMLFLRKDKDYGNSFGDSLDKHGKVAFIVRAEDKVNRIKTLLKQEANVEDEKIEDTAIDLFNYTIMYKCWEKGHGFIYLVHYVEHIHVAIMEICDNKIPHVCEDEWKALGMDGVLREKVVRLLKNYINR